VTDDSDKLLVIGPSWVGDMVMAQVLFRYLRGARPGILIDVLAPDWSAPLLRRMPEVRRALPMPVGHGELRLAQRWRIGRSLRRERYRQAIILPNSLKSALVPCFAGIRRRTGWRGEMRYGLLNDLRVLDRDALPQMVQRFLALGMPRGATLPRDMPVPRLQADPAGAAAVTARVGLEVGRDTLALCPGAEFGPAKQWPASYFAQLAAAYLARGWQVVLLGSDNDREACAQVHGESGAQERCHDLAGRTSLAEALDLLSLASAVVSNDSGLMHIAAALDRPLLAIYGPTSPDFTPPMGDAVAVLQSPEPCAPCFQRECPLGHHRCMRDTGPELAAATLDALLTRQ
jgi:heptosyltransferase-2